MALAGRGLCLRRWFRCVQRAGTSCGRAIGELGDAECPGASRFAHCCLVYIIKRVHGGRAGPPGRGRECGALGRLALAGGAADQSELAGAQSARSRRRVVYVGGGLLCCGRYDRACNSCLSGTETLPLAERWTGSGWLLESTPEASPAGAETVFNAISCASEIWCVAVGYRTTAGLDRRPARRDVGRQTLVNRKGTGGQGRSRRRVVYVEACLYRCRLRLGR